MEPELITAIVVVTLAIGGVAYTKLTGYKMPPKVQAALRVILRLIIKAFTKKKGRE